MARTAPTPTPRAAPTHLVPRTPAAAPRLWARIVGTPAWFRDDVGELWVNLPTAAVLIGGGLGGGAAVYAIGLGIISLVFGG